MISHQFDRLVDGQSPGNIVACLCAILIAIATGLPQGVVRAAMTTYDCEHLVGDVDLLGQDNWFTVNDMPSLIVRTGRGSNPTRLLRGAPGAAWMGCGRDARFNFRSPANSETNYVMQFDVQAYFDKTSGAMMALGKDLALNPGYVVGPLFGLGYTYHFFIREAAWGTPHQSSTPIIQDHWYRVRLAMDFTANGGEGSGSLTIQDLTAGETALRAVPDLQRIDLKMGRLGSTITAASLDQLFVRADRSCPLDNLVLPLNEPPWPVGIGREQPEQITLCWNTITNARYQVEYRKDLRTDPWKPLSGPLPGSGNPMSLVDAVDPFMPEKFYRIVRVEP